MVPLCSSLACVGARAARPQPAIDGARCFGVRPERPLQVAIALTTGLLLFASATLASDTNSLLIVWLNAQTNIQTWSAEVIHHFFAGVQQEAPADVA